MAIESTGVYWRPVFNILEGTLEVILTNARDAKGYKARKTDVIDAEWLGISPNNLSVYDLGLMV